MKYFINWLFSPVAKDYTSNTAYIYKRITTWLALITIFIIVYLMLFLTCNLVSGVTTFLLVACASCAGGAAVGFLFGLPRAEKYRFINKGDTDHNAKDYNYADNTNLEEVSDWLTKIIVGLTLIKFNKIIGWINQSANSINDVFTKGCTSKTVYLNGYVFGYCTIILYFLIGAGLCYLWSRTNLSVILEKSKLSQSQLKNRDLKTKLQTQKNSDLAPTESNISTKSTGFLALSKETLNFPTLAFKDSIEKIYNTKRIFDKTDIQKNRWGGKSRNADFILEAKPIDGVENLQLTIRSTNESNPLIGEVAFFLHDTFPSQIVYSVAVNNLAEIKLYAYEAFVTGARLENGIELELDLNEVKGFPENFYWK